MKLFRAFTIGAVAARSTKKESGGVPSTKAKLGADILFTPNHLAYLEEHGIDTTHYRVDDSLPLLPVEKGANNDLPWKAVWTNPEGFDESHLRIPFRFQPNAFTSQQEFGATGVWFPRRLSTRWSSGRTSDRYLIFLREPF